MNQALDREDFEDAIGQRVAHLLQQVAPPAPLSTAALSRIESRLHAATAPRQTVRWTLLMPALAGLSGVLVGALLLRGPLPIRTAGRGPVAVATCGAGPCAAAAPGEAPHQVQVPAGGTARLSLPGAPGAQVLLLGPGAATLAPAAAHGEPIRLSSGRLLLRAGQGGLEIAVPGGRVTLRPGAAAEIDIHERRGVRVAAYVGSSVVSLPGEAEAVLSAGSSWTVAGVATVEPSQMAAALSALGVEPGPSPASPLSMQVPPQGNGEPVVPRPRAVHHPAAMATAITLPGPAAAVDRAAETGDAGAAGAALPPTALHEESRLLGDALHSLRRDRDGQAALATLDEYAARFPHGSLRPEAAAARVDALLLLGRRDQAREQLEHMDFSAQTRAAEFFVLRGELRGQAGQRAAAVADFTTALADGAAGDIEQRALYGRARGRAQLGDEAGARDDLRRYLERFPGGHFSDSAREALGK